MTVLPSPLFVVTDRHQARHPLDEIVSRALAAGARWIWLRDRDLEQEKRRRLAFRLADLVHRAAGRLSIGDDVRLAQDAGTGAAHMRDIGGVKRARTVLGSSALVGMSAHGLADVAAARNAGADYAALSPIHASASKPGYGPPLGVAAIKAAAAIGIPIVALGGMTTGNAAEAHAHGAAGIAVMGDLMRAKDPAAMTRSLLTALSTETTPASI